ncbi:MAG: hypothetical protein KF901_23765 [Myxococcales bacterium]|nr:hypothetical protein [Myxococcales bacterium]
MGVGAQGVAGNLQVNAYGSRGARCQIISRAFVGDDLVAKVRCRVQELLIDSRFSIDFVRASSFDDGVDYAYLEGGGPASVMRAYHSSMSAVGSVRRLGVGNYLVSFEGNIASAGTAAVTSIGSRGESCVVSGWWSIPGSGVSVGVRCFDIGGRGVAQPSDTLFSLRYQAARRTDVSVALAYATADRSIESEYVPDDRVAYGGGGLVRAFRYGVGSYAIDLPGVVATRAVPVVTAVEDVAAACNPTGWLPSGHGTRVFVRCVNAAGSPMDTRYTVSYRNGPTQYRVFREQSSGVPLAVSRWDGVLSTRRPTGSLVDVPVRSGRRVWWDRWYRNGDGSLSKLVVDLHRDVRGVLTLRSDGTTHLGIDLDGDGIDDLVESSFANGEHLIVVSESQGVASLQAWMNGQNPLCNGAGPDRLTTDDVTAGMMPGCTLQSMVDFAGGFDPRDGGARRTGGSITDPLDLMCEAVSSRDPRFGGVNRWNGDELTPLQVVGTWLLGQSEQEPIVASTGEIITEVLNNGFDGVEDGAAERLARAVTAPVWVAPALLVAYMAETLRNDPLGLGGLRNAVQTAQGKEGKNEQGETQSDTTAETPRSSDTAGGVSTDGSTTERPDRESYVSSLLASACESRRNNVRGRDQWRSAMAPKCDDPTAFGGRANCWSLETVERVDAMAAPQRGAQCGRDGVVGGRCLHETTAEAFSRFMRDVAPLIEVKDLCDPIVCNPMYLR